MISIGWNQKLVLVFQKIISIIVKGYIICGCSSRILEVFKFKFLLQIEVVSNNQVMQLSTGLIQFSKL